VKSAVVVLTLDVGKGVMAVVLAREVIGTSGAEVAAGLIVLAGVALGVEFVWSALPLVVMVIGLATVGYVAIGLVAGALILLFRTAGPIVPGVVAATSLLGGVYYSTSVIPSWIQHLSEIIPLTYALRASRRLFLDGATLGAVGDDVAVLAVLTGALVVLGWVSFVLALRYAKRAGTLSYY